MYCSPGTHEAALSLLQTTRSPTSGVLDLAAGTGAFLARLADHDFTDLHALALNAEKFRLDAIHPVRVDLNSDFAASFDRQFNLVTAIEIIEHLDSPRHFLRQVHTLVSDGGHLLLSTPNVAHWAGRLRFLASGELRFFDADLYHRMRHISPTTDLQMRLMLAETGFSIVASLTAGAFFGPLTRALTAPLAVIFRIACGPTALGDVRIYVARKSEPDRSSPGMSAHSARRARAVRPEQEP
jgi:SAM-dependent methyltransferase